MEIFKCIPATSLTSINSRPARSWAMVVVQAISMQEKKNGFENRDRSNEIGQNRACHKIYASNHQKEQNVTTTTTKTSVEKRGRAPREHRVFCFKFIEIVGLNFTFEMKFLSSSFPTHTILKCMSMRDILPLFSIYW